MPFLPVFLVFVLVVVVTGVVGYRRMEERRQRYAAFAAERGWTYSPEKQRDIEAEYPDFDLFRRGSNRYGENFLTGAMAGREFRAFDYHYQVTSGSGKNRRTTHYRYTVMIVRAEFPLRPLTIRREGMFDRVAAAFGWDDIDFESAEFSRRYHVSGPDRRWAYDVLTPRNMELLLARDPGTIHLDSTRIMVRLPRVKDPSEILPAGETASGLLDGIPEFARTGAPDPST